MPSGSGFATPFRVTVQLGGNRCRRNEAVTTIVKSKNPRLALGRMLAEALIIGVFAALVLVAAVMGVVLAA